MPNMLIDTVSEYDDAKKKYLLDLWEKIVLSMANDVDHRRLLLFLWKAWIIDIDEEKKQIVIWAANEFSLTNIKRNLSKPLKEAVEQCYNSQYWVKFVAYEAFSNANHELLSDLRKLLNIQDEPVRNGPDVRLETGLRNELSNYFWILFEPRYRFDTFVAWSNNQLAFSAAKAVAENPWNEHNPLFLYGNVWLWKTHLMQAVGNEIMERFPDKVVIYLPATKLLDEIVSAINWHTMPQLKKKFEQVDVLLVDDIQFLARAEKTQEIFHDLFNDFHSKNKQVIISGDRPPRELTQITPRLQSRFSYWLVVDIQAPDYETRIAILESKLQSKNIYIDREYLSIIAEHVKSNVRELEWALNSLVTRSKLMWWEITEDLVYDCLKSLGYSIWESRNPIVTWPITNTKNFETLVENVATYYDVSIADIKWNSRKHQISVARQMLMYMARIHFKWEFMRIWDYFWKNYATVIYAVDTVGKTLKTDKQLMEDYRIFADWLQQ